VVFPQNAASLAVHRRVGFREVGRRERIARLRGAWQDTVRWNGAARASECPEPRWRGLTAPPPFPTLERHDAHSRALPSGMTGSAPLDQLLESYLDLRWHLDPVEGSGAGRTADDGRLGSFSDESVRPHLAALRALMMAVERLDVEGLDEEIDRTALLYDIRVAEHRFGRERPHRRDPGLWTGHVLEGLYQLLVARDRDPVTFARSAAGRLAAMPGFVDEACGTLAACPRVLTEGALASVRPGTDLVDEIERSLNGGGHAPPDLAALATAARESLVRFESHLAGLLQSASPEEPWGVGREALEFRLAHQHALRASTAELLRYAAGLIEETERDLTTLARTLGGAPWPDVLNRLREDQLDGAGLVAAYEQAMQRAREHVRTHGLAPVSEDALEVSLTPAYAAPWTPVAAYLPPGPLARNRTGRFFVTAPDGRGVGEHPRASLASIAVHEGFPGHHLHFSSVYASPRPVRRFLLTSTTVEGWALYCEGMMDETGFYTCPEERFFRQVALLWRALRIPMDVGVHTGALTYEDAVGLVSSRLHVPRARAEAEVRRAYASPSGLLAYAVGRRELMGLRTAYEGSAGSAASLRSFHDALFAYGALPWSLMRWGLGLSG